MTNGKALYISLTFGCSEEVSLVDMNRDMGALLFSQVHNFFCSPFLPFFGFFFLLGSCLILLCFDSLTIQQSVFFFLKKFKNDNDRLDGLSGMDGLIKSGLI